VLARLYCRGQFATLRRGRGPYFPRPRRELIGSCLSKKATNRPAMAPAAKLGDSQTMFFMGFS
jgi:hypothetical protein